MLANLCHPTEIWVLLAGDENSIRQEQESVELVYGPLVLGTTPEAAENQVAEQRRVCPKRPSILRHDGACPFRSAYRSNSRSFRNSANSGLSLICLKNLKFVSIMSWTWSRTLW